MAIDAPASTGEHRNPASVGGARHLCHAHRRLLLSGRRLPAFFWRFLGYVPVAAFAALAAPGLATGSGSLTARMAGAVLAAVVVLRFGILWAAIGAGMAGFWLAGLLR